MTELGQHHIMIDLKTNEIQYKHDFIQKHLILSYTQKIKVNSVLQFSSLTEHFNRKNKYNGGYLHE